jgi:hypothetical protein
MTQKIAVGLTVVNAVLLVVLLAQMRPLTAQGTPGVLRGRALEIVDDQGKVRASISVLPPNEQTGFPNTAILRLMDPVTGRPSVKLSTSEKGSGLMLLGDAKTQGTWVILESEGQSNKVRLKTENGPEQLLLP